MKEEGNDMGQYAWSRCTWGSLYKSWLFVGLVVFASTSLDVWILGLDWHDQQRVGELVLLAAALVLLMWRPVLNLPPFGALVLVAVFGVGLLSVFYSEYPTWAFREWGRCVGLVVLFLLLGDVGKKRWVQFIIASVMVVCAFVSVGMFFVYYVMAFVTGVHNLDSFVLLYGFDNVRFLGQFQVLLLPLLVAASAHLKCAGYQLLAALLLLLAVAHWCVAWSLGGRGVWLSLFVAHSALLILGRAYWEMVRWQLLAACVGFVVFWMLFVLCPEWLGIETKIRSGLRVGLSARDQIWEIAWAMAWQHPWLGVGPLHFSATWNHIAAHPHQVVLQWMAEWGLPAAIAVILLILWGMLCSALRLRDRKLSSSMDAGLWVSLCGALLLAQVDGVFVMPYTEGWLAILAGIGLARWRNFEKLHSNVDVYVRSVASLALVAILIQLLVDLPDLEKMQAIFYEKNEIGSPPRLWSQGWIPM